jgi:hypothetical protein
MSDFRVGVRVDDLCRACKMVRDHTVTAVGEGVVRVLCDFCGSQHNYRGGARAASRPSRAGSSAVTPPTDPYFPPVSERETSEAAMDSSGTTTDAAELERTIRRVFREESGLTPVAPAAKWRGGDMVLRPGREGVQEKSWPIETFFGKIVMLRNRLRTMEQQINAAEIPAELKLKLQGYLTACYGSLTSFNVLFADDDDRFRGAGK